MKLLGRLIGRKLALPLYQLARNVPVMSDLRTLGEGWLWSREQLERYQTVKLRRLLVHASRNIPFYRDRFASAGFDPAGLVSLSELEGIPCLTREDMLRLKESALKSAARKRGIASGTSSGTSGVPVSFLKDRQSLGMGRAALFFMQMRGGWQPGDRTVLVWGNPRTVNTVWNRPGARLNAFMSNETRIPACGLSSKAALESALQTIERVRPDFITGYSNSLAVLARCALERGTVPFCRRVFTTAETLLEPARRSIEAAFGPTTDIYGSSEINGIAFQCPDCGLYHAVSPHVHLEFEPLKGNQGASILVTDLDNHAMPFIRYRIGDIASRCDDRTPCPSGTGWLSFSGLLGRLSRVIQFRGRYINPITYFGDSLGRVLMERLPSLVSYQTAWTGSGFITRLHCRENPSGEVLASLDSMMEERLAPLEAPHSFVCSAEPFAGPVAGKETFFVDLSGKP